MKVVCITSNPRLGEGVEPRIGSMYNLDSDGVARSARGVQSHRGARKVIIEIGKETRSAP